MNKKFNMNIMNYVWFMFCCNTKLSFVVLKLDILSLGQKEDLTVQIILKLYVVHVTNQWEKEIYMIIRENFSLHKV